jgi:pimeloyl-ACP methyl ester carboxylesterase
MFVAEHGPDDGVPIVFLHGSMVAGWMWMGQVQDLPEFRCLLPDFPGIGHSGAERWVSLADTADRVAELVRARCSDGSAHVVGLSLGGVVGLHLAVRHPEVVGSLLVSGVPYGTIPWPLRALSSAMIGLYRRPWGARQIARMFGIPDDESLEAFMETARLTDPAALRSVTAEVNLALLPPGLETIAAPTLAVVGAKDTAPARRAVPHLQSVIPGAIGRVVPGVGHQWNAEDPALFSAMVRQWVGSGRVDDRLVPPTAEPA